MTVVTLDMQIKCMKFANETYKKHRKNNRSNSTIKKNIFIGKIAEVAYHNIFYESITSINFEDGNDSGWDFVDNNGIKIDVKSIDADYKDRVYFNFDNMVSDEYALISVDTKTFVCTYLGKCTCEYARKNSKWDDSYKSNYLTRRDFKNDDNGK